MDDFREHTHKTAYDYVGLEPTAKRLPGLKIYGLRANLAELDLEPEDELGASGYNAVSYVWGKPNFTHILYCDNPESHLIITERLYNILLELREDQRQRGQSQVWIDAICINQQDLIERGRQVQCMTQIYRRASQTHVFLGEKKDGASWFASEWFTRRWVIQEFVVSNDIVVHYHDQIDEPSKLSVPYNRRDRWDDLLIELESSQRLEFDNSDEIRTIRTFDGFRSQGVKFLGIPSLLLRFHTAQCVDDRDRLFSIVGIANNVSIRDAEGEVRLGTQMEGNHKGIIDFTADYRMSTQEVYTIFARAVLKSIAPFDILHCAGAFRAPVSALAAFAISTWPSWVPDWRWSKLYEPHIRLSEFSAGLIEGKDRDIDISDAILTISGLYLTTVRSFTAPSAVKTKVELGDSLHWAELDPQEFSSSQDPDFSAERIFIETGDERWAVAPPDTLPGDVIVIFYGTRTPFLLRHVPGKYRFRLIGDCYLNGGMYAFDLRRDSHLKDKRFAIV